MFLANCCFFQHVLLVLFLLLLLLLQTAFLDINPQHHSRPGKCSASCSCSCKARQCHTSALMLLIPALLDILDRVTAPPALWHIVCNCCDCGGGGSCRCDTAERVEWLFCPHFLFANASRLVLFSFVACDARHAAFYCVDFRSKTLCVCFVFSPQLTKTKEHGKLNPRPGKVTLVLFVSFYVK